MSLHPLRNSARTRIVLAWLAVAMCVAAIWTLSSDGFSSHETGRLLRPLLQWFWPDISPRMLWAAHVWVRKSAHVLEYAALALLACRAIWLTFETSLGRIAGLALALVLFVAAVDESRQGTMSSRSGSPRDVALDFTGGLAAVGLFLAFRRSPRSGATAPRA